MDTASLGAPGVGTARSRQPRTDPAQHFAPKKYLDIDGHRMAYIDEGHGDAIVFQHGNPTSPAHPVTTDHPGGNMSATTDTYQPSTTDWVREQVELYERTNGAEGNTLNSDPDMPVVILTSTGAKTGKIRKTPVMRIEHHGRYAAVAAVGGAPTNPGWYHNLLANPTVELRDRAAVTTMRAREATGAEKDEWIARTDILYPWYPDYRQKAAAAGRDIPLFVLEPLPQH